MVKVFIVFNDEKQIEKVRELDNGSLTFCYIDICTKKGKKEGWNLKNHWGAKLDPFVIVYKEDKPVKAFYTETGDFIEELTEYLSCVVKQES